MIGTGLALAEVGAPALNRSASTATASPPAYRYATGDVIARDLYLRGRAAWWRRTPSSLADATQLFGEAVARDPRMTHGYVGLADAWLLRREYAAFPRSKPLNVPMRRPMRHSRSIRRCRARSARRVSSISGGGRDEVKGLAELRRAVLAVPDDAQSHHWLSTALETSGDNKGAMREIDAARALDPANPAILADRAAALIYADRLNKAVAASREITAA